MLYCSAHSYHLVYTLFDRCDYCRGYSSSPIVFYHRYALCMAWYDYSRNGYSMLYRFISVVFPSYLSLFTSISPYTLLLAHNIPCIYGRSIAIHMWNIFGPVCLDIWGNHHSLYVDSNHVIVPNLGACI